MTAEKFLAKNKNKNTEVLLVDFAEYHVQKMRSELMNGLHKLLKHYDSFDLELELEHYIENTYPTYKIW